MTLFLHVGFPKTGTSSIQATLRRAGDRLRAAHSINYPAFATNHWQLALPFLGSEKWGRLEREIKRTGRSRRDYLREADVLLRKFGREQGKFTHNILSSEHFVALEEKTAQSFLQYLEALGRPVKVIIYIRHPADDASSRIQQNIKTGVRSIAGMGGIQNRSHAQLDSLLNVYGKERIIAKKFDPKGFYQNDLISDFMNVVSEDTDFSWIERIRLNDSYSLPAILILDKLYQLSDKNTVLQNRKMFAEFVSAIKGPKFLAPRPLVERYLRRHKEYLSLLQSEFGIVFDEVDMEKFPDKLSYEFADETLTSIAELLKTERLKKKRYEPMLRLRQMLDKLRGKP